MKTILSILVAVVAVTVAANAEMQKLADWCSVDQPAEAKLGQPVEIKVQLHGVKPGTKVNLDLHWRKKDGKYGGMNIWGGPAQDVKEDGLHTFRAKPANKPDIAAVHALIYLTPSGEYKDLTQKITSPDIKIVE
jgi:hypothetical protein